jgi:hypothetical protein
LRGRNERILLSAVGPWNDIVDLQPREIAPSEFAVDRKVEQG